MAKFIETQSRMVVSRGWREKVIGTYWVVGRELVWDDEKVLGMDDGEGCTTV